MRKLFPRDFSNLLFIPLKISTRPCHRFCHTLKSLLFFFQVSRVQLHIEDITIDINKNGFASRKMEKEILSHRCRFTFHLAFEMNFFMFCFCSHFFFVLRTIAVVTRYKNPLKSAFFMLHSCVNTRSLNQKPLNIYFISFKMCS